MNTSFHKTAILLTAVTLIAGSVFGQWKAGDTLPALSEFQLAGEQTLPVSGKIVLLDFWASWCPPCKNSFPMLEQLQNKYASQGLLILAVSVDEDAAKMDQFLKANPVSFPVVRDTRQELVEHAQIEAMPSSYLIDREGVIRFVHTGFHENTTPAEYEAQIHELLGETGGGTS